MVFRQKVYDRLKALSQHWEISLDDICYSIEIGKLRACVWLPPRHVEVGTIRNKRFEFLRYETMEGLVGIRPQDFRIIVSKGYKNLRHFHSLEMTEQIIQLPHEPPSPSYRATLDAVFVLRSDQEEFERRHFLNVVQMQPKRPVPDTTFIHSPDYRHVQFGKCRFLFGEVQAQVVRHLHRASSTSQPWVHVDTLIEISGANADRLRDIFRSKKNWKKLIMMDGKGYYRLNIEQEQITNSDRTECP